jgi:hypothetical protein
LEKKQKMASASHGDDDRSVRDLRMFRMALSELQDLADAARDRLHVFTDMDDEAAEGLLSSKAEEINNAWMAVNPDYDTLTDPPLVLTQTLYLLQGPLFGEETTRHVDEADDPPTGWLYYILHTYSEDPAPNLMAPPDVRFGRGKINWVQGRGYEYNGAYHPTIGDVETRQLANWQGFENPDVASELQGHLDAIESLNERHRALRVNLTPHADITVVTGSVGLPVTQFDNTHLQRTVAEVQPTSILGRTRVLRDEEMVDDFLEVVLGIRDAEHAVVFLWEADTMKRIEPTTTSYMDFKIMLALADPQPARLQIIEHPPALTVIRERERRQERQQKRRRVDTDALYQLGASIAGERDLEVHRLHSGEGLIVVDASTGDAICEHVHTVSLEALAGEQDRTGKVCPRC